MTSTTSTIAAAGDQHPADRSASAGQAQVVTRSPWRETEVRVAGAADVQAARAGLR
ncbi:hypothetical protein FHS23_003334 [Prauserella isguenensis]|uniref:Uncharacterized protein n=1 Tax=Prauserella isguenensis TaxID=1470180 RepID=A0A839S5L6_9PSEU|nr:hypothetical protein [Prauserella isguenensis]MBB3052300.1 hypothetical protein [Prauserella isguenensis]